MEMEKPQAQEYQIPSLTYTNFAAQTSSFTCPLSGTNSITIQLPSGTYSLSKSILSFQVQFTTAVANNYHMIHTDSFAFLSQLVISFNGMQVANIQEFASVSKLLGLQIDHENVIINSEFFRMKNPDISRDFTYSKGKVVLANNATVTLANVSQSISLKNLPDQIYLYNKLNPLINVVNDAEPGNQVLNTMRYTNRKLQPDIGRCVYQQYSNFDQALNTNSAFIVQIQLNQLLPKSFLSNDEFIYIPTSLEFQLTFQGTQNWSFLAQPLGVSNQAENIDAASTNYPNIALTCTKNMTITNQSQTATISQIELIAARPTIPIPLSQIRRQIPIGFWYINFADRTNDVIRLQRGMGHRLNQQVFSLFTSNGENSNKYNNSVLDFDNFYDANNPNTTHDRITDFQLQIDNMNILQTSTPTSAQFKTFMHLNKPKYIDYTIDNFLYYNWQLILDYTGGKNEYMGKSLDQERYFSFNSTLYNGGANQKYVLCSNVTKVLEYSEDYQNVLVL